MRRDWVENLKLGLFQDQLTGKWKKPEENLDNMLSKFYLCYLTRASCPEKARKQSYPSLILSHTPPVQLQVVAACVMSSDLPPAFNHPLMCVCFCRRRCRVWRWPTPWLPTTSWPTRWRRSERRTPTWGGSWRIIQTTCPSLRPRHSAWRSVAIEALRAVLQPLVPPVNCI